MHLVPFPPGEAEQFGCGESREQASWTGMQLRHASLLIVAERPVVQNDRETGAPPSSAGKLVRELSA